MSLIAAPGALAQGLAPGSIAPSLRESAGASAPSMLIPPTSAATQAANIHPAVARIVAPSQGSVSYGSGTLVYADQQAGLVVTNWHVINEASGSISVHFPDGFYSLGSVVRVDRDWDLALIAIRKPNATPVPLASAAPRPGEVLTIAGYGSGDYRAASGYCTQYVAPGTTFPFEIVEVAVSARQGDSGGPIFNAQGELAGVLFGEGNGRTSGSYCGRVRWFLSSVVPDGPTGNALIAAASLPPAVVNERIAVQPASRQVEPDLPMVAIAPTPTMQTIHVPAPAAATNSAATLAAVPSAPAGQPLAAVTPAVESLGWEDFAGTTWGEQAKTVLALVGVLGLIFHVLRWLGAAPPQA
jgi:hypothetical protein